MPNVQLHLGYAGSGHLDPYSIVNDGQGICGGYAILMKYLLNQCGVEAEIVSNTGHAWNLVRIDGKWYHCDVTFGAGTGGDTMNSLSYILMDDATRQQSLEASGMGGKKTVMGFGSIEDAPAPACLDNRFRAYNDVGWCYTLDLDRQAVFFSGWEGIEMMDLNCTGRHIILKDVFTCQMACFGGDIYYVDINDGHLYRVGSDGEPELVDCGGEITDLKVKNATLTYAFDKTGASRSMSICRACRMHKRPLRVNYRI